MFWNKYPYTDFSQINLDWLVRRLAEFMRVFDRSGGLLPKFTKSDNGKVLTVRNGAAGWETPQETILVINVNNGTMDKTAQEIITAFESGISCMVKKSTEDEHGTDYIYSYITTYEMYDDNELGKSYAFPVIFVKAEVTWDNYSASSLSDYPVLDE